MKALTISKLIRLLEELPDQKATVVLAGCDCAGACVGLSQGKEAYEGQVILRRDNDVFNLDDLETVYSTTGKIK